MNGNRRAIPNHCTTHGGTPLFTNLLMSERDGTLVLDPPPHRRVRDHPRPGRGGRDARHADRVAPMNWYLRSLADHDTHRGTWSGASRSVHSMCGLVFQPVALPYGGFSCLERHRTKSDLLAVPPRGHQWCPVSRPARWAL